MNDGAGTGFEAKRTGEDANMTGNNAMAKNFQKG